MAITLARRLLAHGPSRRVPVRVRVSLDRIATAIPILETAWNGRDRPTMTVNPRPIDALADTAWGAMHARLAAFARLPADLYPDATRAAALLALLFPTGLDFLRLDFDRQWAEMQRRMQRIADEALEADLERLAGSEFLAELRRTFDDYGRAIGVTQKKEARVEAPAVGEPLRDVTRAMASYALQLVAWHDEGDADAQAQVRAALRPYDELRAGQLRRNGNGRGPTGEGPVEPPVDGGDDAPDPANSPDLDGGVEPSADE